MSRAIWIGIVLLAVLADGCFGQSGKVGDWPDFLGPTRNGKSKEHGVPEKWPAKGPTVVWQKQVGTGYSAPAISGDRLFHFARYGDSERLTCFNAKTGEQIWTCEYPTDYTDLLGYNNGPRATPVVDGPNGFTYGAEGMLQCVHVADGKKVWRVDTTKDFHVVKNFFGVASTPLVWNDLLLVNVGGSPPGGRCACLRRQWQCSAQWLGDRRVR